MKTFAIKRYPPDDWKRWDHRYLDIGRLYSFIFQLIYAMSCEPRRILYVGKATGIAPYLLSQCPEGPKVITLDIEEKFEPDIVGSVLDIPLEDLDVDVTVCGQVLEHLPFEDFMPALKEMRRVTRERLVLSLPDRRLFFGMRVKIPLLKFNWRFSLPKLPPGQMPADKFEKAGHYWEVGHSGTEMKVIKQKIREAGWVINEIRRVDDMSWHTFFDLHQPK